MGSGASKEINPATVQFVKDTIAQNRIVIFSKRTCPYCKMAKDVRKNIEKEIQ
jgi:thioredoxin-related protein